MPTILHEDEVFVEELGDTALYDAPPFQAFVEDVSLIDTTVVIPTVQMLDFWSNSRYDEPANVRPARVITTAMQTPAVAGANAFGRVFSVWHALDTDGAITIDLEFDRSSTVAQTVGFKTSGDAKVTTNYTITASPITVAAGATTATITVTPVATADYHPERKLIVTLDPLTSSVPIADQNRAGEGGGGDECHIWIRSSTAPPTIDFNAPTSAPAPGTRDSIAVDVLTGVSAHEDDIEVYVEADAASTAVEGKDYVWVLDPNGGLPIKSGEAQRSVLIDILPGATATKTIVVKLQHERSLKEDQNRHATTGTYESTKLYTGPLGTEANGNTRLKHFPGEGGLNAATLVSRIATWSPGPGPAIPPDAPGGPYIHAFDSAEIDPWGDPIPTLTLDPTFSVVNSYYRPDSEGATHSASPPDTAQIILPIYQRRSVYVVLPTGGTYPRFTRLGTRERGFTFAKTGILFGSEESLMEALKLRYFAMEGYAP